MKVYHNAIPGQCQKYNKFGHNKNDCRMNIRCFACIKYGHLSNHYRSISNTNYSKAIQKNNVSCYSCHKIGHIAKFCRSKNMLSDNEKSLDTKGKKKVEEIHQQFIKQWIPKYQNKTEVSGPLLIETNISQLAKQVYPTPIGISS